MFKKIKYIITAIILITSFNTSATLISSTFEGGIPDTWDCKGNCGTSSANGDVTTSPTGNNTYGWISTDYGMNKVGLNGLQGKNGSILRSDLFLAKPGDSLEFYFNYVTSDGAGFSDYAWSRLLNDSFTQVAMLFTARTNHMGSLTSSNGMPTTEASLTPNNTAIIQGAPNWEPLGKDSGDCWDTGCGYTDWTQSKYSIANSGNYYLEFGVVNWTDKNFDSGLAFDGITIAGVAFDNLEVAGIKASKATNVPEPTTLYLFALAFIGLISFKRDRI